MEATKQESDPKPISSLSHSIMSFVEAVNSSSTGEHPEKQ